MHWKPALNAFEIAFDGRLAARLLLDAARFAENAYLVIRRDQFRCG
ncbi:hypothetical protein GCM10022267_84840 [Lentzea roselyniae]|uniref:Uncharacterized protein n=1 Tax=Lentzea roselyniae TaxID=531940 RepID=A0ABP7CDI6_9PSEU